MAPHLIPAVCGVIPLETVHNSLTERQEARSRKVLRRLIQFVPNLMGPDTVGLVVHMLLIVWPLTLTAPQLLVASGWVKEGGPNTNLEGPAASLTRGAFL